MDADDIVPRRRSTDNSKTLGQIAFEARHVAEYKSKFVEEPTSAALEVIWDRQSPIQQFFWEAAAQAVVDEIQRRLAAAAAANR